MCEMNNVSLPCYALCASSEDCACLTGSGDLTPVSLGKRCAQVGTPELAGKKRKYAIVVFVYVTKVVGLSVCGNIYIYKYIINLLFYPLICNIASLTFNNYLQPVHDDLMIHNLWCNILLSA